MTPTVAAHLTLVSDGKLRRAFGAKADGEINHHRLVREWLDAQPRGHLVRGAERHAELILVSDILHEIDAVQAQENRPPVDLETARRLFAGGRYESFHVRDIGDEHGGRVAEHCATCAFAHIHFGVYRERFLRMDSYEPASRTSELPPPDPDRFPPDVAGIVVRAGWPPSDRAALNALTRYAPLYCRHRGPGVEFRVVPFDLDPRFQAGTAKALADFGGLIGMPLFPIGEDADNAVIAIDLSGRVFVLDQAGEWHVGDTVEAAIVNPIRGTGQRRVNNDGTW